MFREIRANLDHEDNYGYTPLTISAAEGKLDLTKLLIENGAGIDCKNKFNKSVASQLL